MATNYPASADDGTSLPNPATTDKRNSPSHAGLHSNENDAIKALEAKLGTGASTPVVSTLLFGTATGTSAWTQLTSAQLAASMSDETGSGAVVFANTPTLVTPKVDTINEATSSNGVTVGGVNLKSGVITTANAVTDTAVASGGLKTTKVSNPYKFRVYRTSAQNTGNGAFAVVNFDTKTYDTGSNVDVATNKGRFTAPVAGFYHFDAMIQAALSAAGNEIIASLYVNGSEVSRGADARAAGSTENIGSIVSDTLQLSANDYVEVYSFGTAAYAISVGSVTNHFSGFLQSAT